MFFLPDHHIQKKFEVPKTIMNLAERFGNRRPEHLAPPVQQQPIMRTVLTKQVPAAHPPGGLPSQQMAVAPTPPQVQVIPTVNLVKQIQQQQSSNLTVVPSSEPAPIQTIQSTVPPVGSIPVLTSVGASDSSAPDSPSVSSAPVQVLTTTPAVPTPTVQVSLKKTTFCPF